MNPEQTQNGGNIMGKGCCKHHICTLIVGIIIGLVVAFAINALCHRPPHNGPPPHGLPPLIYTPNAVAERKPMYMQILKTQQDVDAVKATKVYLSDQLTIGSGVTISAKGFNVYLKKELDLSNVHIKDIGPQADKKVLVGDYSYIPNAVVKVDPSPIQLLESPEDVFMASKIKDLLYPADLSVGSAIVCGRNFPCYVIPKKDVEDRLIVKRFPSSRPADGQESAPLPPTPPKDRRAPEEPVA